MGGARGAAVGGAPGGGGGWCTGGGCGWCPGGGGRRGVGCRRLHPGNSVAGSVAHPPRPRPRPAPRPTTSAVLQVAARLSRDPFPAAAARLAALQADWGGAAPGSALATDAASATLTAPACIYHAVLAPLPHGTACLAACCCSADRVWFDGLASRGVAVVRPAWLGAGDPACVLRVERVGVGGG